MEIAIKETLYGDKEKQTLNVLKPGTIIFFLWKNLVIKTSIEALRISLFETDYEKGGEPYSVGVEYITEVDGSTVKVKGERAFLTLKDLRNSLSVDEDFSSVS